MSLPSGANTTFSDGLLLESTSSDPAMAMAYAKVLKFRFWLEPKYGKIGVFNNVAIDDCSGAATLLTAVVTGRRVRRIIGVNSPHKCQHGHAYSLPNYFYYHIVLLVRW